MDSPILAPWCGCKSADEAHAHLNHGAAALSGQHSLPAVEALEAKSKG